MEIHLIRHAHAEPPREDLPDADRALTGKGERQGRRLHRALRRLGVRYGLLLTSPKLRAAQTAAFLDGLAEETRLLEALAAEPDAELVEWLRELSMAGLERLAVVGHEPHLSALCATLLGQPALAGGLEVRKGGVYALEWPEPARLRWMLPQRVLREL